MERLLPFQRNAADLDWEAYTHGRFGSEDKGLTDGLSARRLSCVLTRLAPGQVSSPYHFHHVEEELFLVLEGTGRLRYDGREVRVQAQDVITCPPGPGSAHQLINDGDGPLTYYVVSTVDDHDLMEYPDSGKLFAVARGARAAVFKLADAVDYWEGEA